MEKIEEEEKKQEEETFQVDRVEEEEGEEQEVAERFFDEDLVMPVKSDKPTEEEMVEHRKTHLPYRSWCEECVAGKGRVDPHRRQEFEEDAKPILELDYFDF